MSSLRGALLVAAAAALWGTTGTAQALGPDTASPASVGAWRIVFGGGVLLAIAAATGSLRGLLAGGSRRAAVLLLGGAVVAGYQLAFFSAVARTGVAVGTVVAIGSAPILTGLLSRVLGGPLLTLRWAVATAGAIAGCALLVLGGRRAGVDPAGVGLALLAGGSYAVYAVTASRLIRSGLSERGVMGALFGIGACALLPVAALGENAWLVSATGVAVTAWLAIGATAAAYLLYGRGLRVVPVSVAATVGLAEPGVATLLGLVVLGESIGVLAGAGLLVLAASLVLAVLPARDG